MCQGWDIFLKKPGLQLGVQGAAGLGAEPWQGRIPPAAAGALPRLRLPGSRAPRARSIQGASGVVKPRRYALPE